MSESKFIKAADKGDLKAVQSLVDKVNVNSKDSDGRTALWNAALRGHLDVVKFLVARKDVDVNLASVRTKDCHHLNMSLLTLAICITNTFPLFISLLLSCNLFRCSLTHSVFSLIVIAFRVNTISYQHY